MIPRYIVERDKQGIESVTYYGILASELSRDELLAALNVCKKQNDAAFRNYMALSETFKLVVGKAVL